MSGRNGPLAWGRTHHFRHILARPSNSAEAIALLKTCAGPVLGYGQGRSYGDSCLNDGGLLLDTGSLDHFIAFDPCSGLVEAQAGVTLAEVLACLCQPSPDGSAWFPPVTPGTSWVTLGGAVANDIHGKNHHRYGSFGCHTPDFKLLRHDGQLLHCSAEQNEDLYRATIGGLGLTGLILSVSLRLRRVPGLMLVAEDIRFGGLDEFYELAAESESGWEYTVAWIDCLARGKAVGRGVFSRANHIPGPVAVISSAETKVAVPFAPPISPLSPITLRLFNSIYWHRLGMRGRTRRIMPYARSLYPLDAIGRWNLLYGRRGFHQYQCVLPPATARDGIAELLECIARSGEGSFLAVLKTMGRRSSPGLLAFSREGTTLALDFPNRGTSTLALLDRLDAIMMMAGGRVYPAKDGRMSAGTFAAGYPELSRFRRSIDPGFSSSFWRRVAADGDHHAASTPLRQKYPRSPIGGLSCGRDLHSSSTV